MEDQIGSDFGLDSAGSGYCPGTGRYEHVNKPSDSKQEGISLPAAYVPNFEK
jgi:hypothetical protein